ncbi:MAG TPA: TonB-dependent receptor plug domain-containing protein [Bacteroidales bacterium]
MKFLLVLLSVLLFQSSVFSQFTLTGKIVDEGSLKPIESAHIVRSDGKNGSVSDSDGNFTIEISSEKEWLTIKALGFKSKSVFCKAEENRTDIGRIELVAEPYSLDEITISAGMVQEKEKPVTVSTITAKTIQKELGDRPLPFIMNTVPGVFSARTGGGSGDAELSIRGFNQENVGLLLNGVPINGAENGLVFWSNYLTLVDAAAEIQIQKGPGIANAATNSVGGSVNIITEPAAKEKGGFISFQITNYANFTTTLGLNSGKMSNGWSISFLGSFINGPGYIDATYVRGWSYYLALSKQLNDKNRIVINLLGDPQVHGQRTLKLSNAEHNFYGNLYNKDWGSYNGEINNASENFYHNPFLSFNHYLKIDDTKKLANTFYLTYGNGGGKWSESFNYAPSIFEYRNPSGQIDWNTIYDNNASNEDEYTLANGETVSGYSINIQTDYLASNIRAGLLSTYEQQFNKKLKLVAGIHYRYFNSYLREEISDLLGGLYYIDTYAWAVDGVSGRQQVKSAGDIINVENNSIINFANAYAQLIFDNQHFNAYVSVNGNNNWYQRIDNYNYVDSTKSETIVRPGFDVRGGISYKPGIKHIVYVNSAFISRAPYFKFVFGNFTNVSVQNLQNEKISTIEAGYKFETPVFNSQINAYYTYWQNVSILSEEYVQLENNLQSRAMINGLDALHKGIELEMSARIQENARIGAMLNLANYTWQNNVSATLFDGNNVAVDTVNVYAKGLYVGGTPQQQVGAFLSFRLLQFFNIKAEWQYNNRMYAYFNPNSRSNPDDTSQPYQIPAFNTVNCYVSIPFHFFKKTALFQFNTYNLLNTVHIEIGEDGPNHDLDTFRGFWSFGRTFDFMLRLNF